MGQDVLVIILRRDENELTPEERVGVFAAFRGKQVVFRRTDPKDYLEHAEQCLELKPAVVLLPRDRPLVSSAMEDGFPHVTVIPGRGLVELLPLFPQFKDFVPS